MAKFCFARLKSLITISTCLELIAALISIESVDILNETRRDIWEHKVCYGTNYQKEVHHLNLKDTYTNCTFIIGNLELTLLQDPDLDFSFLEHIREVTGYLLIYSVRASNVSLPRLQTIRGTTLFYSEEIGASFALYVDFTGIITLELPALRNILNGSVGFFDNPNLCCAQSMNWTKIISGPYDTKCSAYFSGYASECPSCHEICKESSWGADLDYCQKIDKENCASECKGASCFGSSPNECCHPYCADGCTGPTIQQCIFCENIFDDNACEENSLKRENNASTKYLWHADSSWKILEATCYKECPYPSLEDDGICVLSCPIEKEVKDNKCVPCNGLCRRICPGLDVLIHSGNIDNYIGCTTINGSIVIENESFAGDEGFGPMHPKRLEVFSTVREITGNLYVKGHDSAFENLSFFRNLEVIHGKQKFDIFNMSLIIHGTSLKSLGLKNLKSIKSGGVEIMYNYHLCYVDSIDWLQLKKSSKDGVYIKNNRYQSKCVDDGFICSTECNGAGCWGGGNEQCMQCKNFSLNGICLANCSQMNAFKFNNNTCHQCHSECNNCTGPGPEHCLSCANVKTEGVCMSKCPVNKYADSGICHYCHAACKDCKGPESTIGPEGCKTCNFAVVDNNGYVVRCLLENAECPDGYYRNDTRELSGGRLECHKCAQQCELCSGYGFHKDVCLNCTGYMLGDQCLACHSECKGCRGPGSKDCKACRNYKLFNDLSFDNFAFNCTSNCPAEFPIVTNSDTHGAHCSSNRLKTITGIEKSLFSISIAVALVIMLCIIFVVVFICRRKLRSKEDALKMTRILSGVEDEEPLHPTDTGANLTKLYTIKESALCMGDILGMGAFGRVYKGVWTPEGENIKVPVAIKELNNAGSAETGEEFLQEAYIMASVKHPHLLRLLGVCIASQMLLVTQLMPLGCLLDYVRNSRDKISSKSFLNWCLQIAKGMAYLEEKRLVHRDLAARNVLVQNPACVKITDFGLAKLLSSESNEYKTAGGKLPIKWLALECMRHGIFTSKSDVWSFGITVWELLTYGRGPFENIAVQNMIHEIENGLKLEQPEICSLDVYLILVSCWHFVPESRPCFKRLVDVFADFSSDPGRYLAISGDSFIRSPTFETHTEVEYLKNLAATTGYVAEVVTARAMKNTTKYNKLNAQSLNDNRTYINTQITENYVDIASQQIEAVDNAEYMLNASCTNNATNMTNDAYFHV